MFKDEAVIEEIFGDLELTPSVIGFIERLTESIADDFHEKGMDEAADDMLNKMFQLQNHIFNKQ